MIYVLDACALIAILNAEPGSGKVHDLLAKSLTAEVSVVMSPVNLTEVYYDRINTVGLEKANEIYDWIKAAITIPDDISDNIIREAGRIKSKYKCSLGDSFGLATAFELSGQFVTADHHELDEIEKHESIQFLWFR
jgi:predicted nucleic acid-binding protein